MISENLFTIHQPLVTSHQSPIGSEHILKDRLLKFFIFTLILFLILGSWLIFCASPPPGKVKVTIERGYTVGKIAEILAEKKVVSNAYLFKFYLSYNDADRNIIPGQYTFRQSMSFSEAMAILNKAGDKKFIKVVVPEGFTVKQIGLRLETQTNISPDDFDQLALRGAESFESDHAILQSNQTSSLEGYLFPKTYLFDDKKPSRDIIETMLTQFEKETSYLDWPKAQSLNMNVHQILTIASLIEREAKLSEERSLISAVIYNRLKKGMALEIDASVQYALPEWKPKLTRKDLRIDSPYNTRRYKGLPPGPICNPGLPSIAAALNPADVDYLYFVLTDASGRHTFTNSYEEFEKAKAEAKKRL